jgi:hypothetical protein
MAFTPEQQANLDIQLAVEAARQTNQLALEATRQANQIATISAQLKVDAVRLAQQTLIENARSKPVDGREVTATDIANFANTLVASVNL